MPEWVIQALAQVADSSVLQALLAAVCTIILEDPTMVGCAVLVADGSMRFSTALIGLTCGIALGDWGLYLLGRFFGPKTVQWGLVSQARLDQAGAWFNRNLVAALFVSRFIPGLRVPTNLAAGLIQAPVKRYLPVALAASIVWTLLTLTVLSEIGRFALPLLGILKWPLMIALILGLLVLQLRSMRYVEVDIIRPEAKRPPVSFFEFWPPALFYIPVAIYYCWLAIRYRSLTLPTAANPSIYSGGVISESKTGNLDLIPAQFQKWIAPYARFDNPGGAPAGLAPRALELLRAKGISFPVVAKPDEGQRGTGVFPVYTESQLEEYLASVPEDVAVCFQQLVPYDHEAGILYYRHPNENQGQITSITLKEFPEVEGDGVHTVRELIERHERARDMAPVFLQHHENDLDRILDEGERFRLLFAANHKQGCVFREGLDILTPQLNERFDDMAKATPGFHFGRYDVRYKDLSSLREGEDFFVIELNGAGAEATHIWDPDTRLFDAYRTLFEEYRILFKIGHTNRRRGYAPMGPIRFLKGWARHRRIAKRYSALREYSDTKSQRRGTRKSGIVEDGP